MSTEPTKHDLQNEPTEDEEVTRLRARLREIAAQAAHAAEYQARLFTATNDPNDLIAGMNAVRLAKELTEDEDEWIMRIRGAAKD